MPPREWIAHERSEGEEEADQPGMLIEPPELEADAAGSNTHISRRPAIREGDSGFLCACSLDSANLHAAASFSPAAKRTFLTTYCSTPLVQRPSLKRWARSRPPRWCHQSSRGCRSLSARLRPSRPPLRE